MEVQVEYLTQYLDGFCTRSREYDSGWVYLCIYTSCRGTWTVGAVTEPPPTFGAVWALRLLLCAAYIYIYIYISVYIPMYIYIYVYWVYYVCIYI